MRLSKLQKYILIKCFEKRGLTLKKEDLYKFYGSDEVKKNLNSVQIRVAKSIDNLVEKDLAVALGRKTKKKWFVENVRLSPKGKKAAQELLLKKQKKLPII